MVVMLLLLLHGRHIRRRVMVRVLLHGLGQLPRLHHATHWAHVPLLSLTVRLALAHDAHLVRLVPVLGAVLLRNTSLHVPCTGTVVRRTISGWGLCLHGQVTVASVHLLLLLEGQLHLLLSRYVSVLTPVLGGVIPRRLSLLGRIQRVRVPEIRLRYDKVALDRRSGGCGSGI